MLDRYFVMKLCSIDALNMYTTYCALFLSLFIYLSLPWCFKPLLFCVCSHCFVIQIQILLQIRKLLGCLVRTSVNTIGEYVRLSSRVGLLISSCFGSIVRTSMNTIGEFVRLSSRVGLLIDSSRFGFYGTSKIVQWPV